MHGSDSESIAINFVFGTGHVSCVDSSATCLSILY